MEAKTLSVPDAGRLYYDLGKNASYDAAKRGEIPTIKIVRLLRVPVVAIERQLEMVAATAEGSLASRDFEKPAMPAHSGVVHTRAGERPKRQEEKEK